MSLHRLAPSLLRLATVLAGLLCLLLLAGAILLHTQPRLLLDPVATAIAEALPGSRFTALSARPSLWPSPGVVLKEAVLHLPDGNALFAESLECHLDWRSLALSLITLDGFNARLHLPDTAASPKTQPAKLLQVLPQLTHSLTLDLRDGHLELLPAAPSDDGTNPPAPLLDLRDLNGQIQLPAGTRPGSLDLRLGSLRQTLFDGVPLPVPHTLRQVDVHLDNIMADPDGPLGLHLRTMTVNLLAGSGSVLQRLTLQLQLAPPQMPMQQGSLLFDATIRPPNYPASARPLLLRANLPFALASGPDWSLRIDDGQVALDEDSLRLTMTVRSDATAAGTVQVAHLSLPHWFSFARALPDGLVTALDAISGTLRFNADAHGLNVPELRASLAGHSFTGSAKLTDFQRPSLVLNASTQTADLGKLLPELHGHSTAKPLFDVPPLDAPSKAATAQTSPAATTKPRTDDTADSPILSHYDIRLRADSALWDTLSGKGLFVTITPGPSNPDDTRLILGVESLYGGNATMTLDIADRCAIRLKASGLDARMLDTLLPEGLAPRGTLNAAATLSAPSGDIDTLTRHLAGSASVELLNGSLHVSGTRQAFSRLQLSTTGQTTRTEPSGSATKLFWKGSWKLLARTSSPSAPLAPLDVTLTVDGETAFLSRPLMPLGGQRLTLRATGTVLGGHTDCTARLSLSLPQGPLALRGLRGDLAGCAIQGDVAATSLHTSLRWTAQGTVTCNNLPPLLHHLGLSLPQPGAAFPQRLNLSASLTLDQTTLRLDNLTGNLDGTNIQGTVLRSAREVPHWDITLRLDRFNLAQYMPPQDKPGKASSDDIPIARRLRGMTATVTLEAGELVLGEIPFQQVSATAILTNGLLKITPCSASCGGGPVSAALIATARQDDTTATALQLNASEVDLGRLSDMVDVDVRLRGKARFATQLSGVFRTPSQAVAAQNGTWSLNFGTGSFTPLEPRTQKPESTYHILGASASGTLKNAIITCDDLRIQGKDFNARGRGIINLHSNTLDYTINASIPGVPNIPIRYSGSLSDPTRRINAFKVLTSVFANVGRHAFSLMKDIISVPFSIIK